jgi:outer membrane PBP1 activator LpoA protein
MKTLTNLALAIILVACASETEKQSLDLIADLYGAKTSYSKGINASTGEETIRKFNVVVSESKLIDSLAPTVTSANIALIVYESLNEEERKKYDIIDVELHNLKNDTVAYTYPTEILKKLQVKTSGYYDFSQSIVDGNFHKLDAMRDVSELPKPFATSVKAYVNNAEDLYGDLRSFERFGIAEMQDDKGSAYQFQGNFVFNSGKKIPYTYVVDILENKDKLIGFKFFD